MSDDPSPRAATKFFLPYRAPLLLAGVLIFVFGAVLLGQTESSVFGRVPLLDEVYYLDRAADISGGQWTPDEPSFMSPLYPYLAALAGAGGGVPESRVFAGAELRGLRLFQMACWLGTLVLIRLLAGRLVPPTWSRWSRAVGRWGPVALFALYRPAVVYAMAALLEAPLLLLVTLAIYLMTSPTEPKSLREMLLLGVVLGLAGLLRGTVLLLVPVALLAVWWHGGAGRRLVLNVIVMLAGVTLVLAPPTIHNSVLADQLVGPSLNGGVNLYIGNGPEANGFYVAAVPGDWRHDPAGRAFLAERFGRPEVSLAAADRLWSAEAWHHMKADPARVLRLMGRKIWLQVQGWEIDQLTPLAGWTTQVPILKVLVTPYALLVVLGLVGLSTLRGNRAACLLFIALVVLILGQSLFFIVSRYRLILVPFWTVLAGVGAVELYRRGRVAVVVAVLAGILTVPWGLNDIRESWVALAQANEAVRWADVGVADRSEVALNQSATLYRRSLAVENNRLASWLGLAAVLGDLNQTEAKTAALREGIDVVPEPLALQKILLADELTAGRAGAALSLAQNILRDHPHDADTLHNASVLLARSGQMAAALATAEQLQAAHPADPRGYVDVGVLLARAGRRDEANSVFRKGLEHCPDHPDLLRNLSVLGQ